MVRTRRGTSTSPPTSRNLRSAPSDDSDFEVVPMRQSARIRANSPVDLRARTRTRTRSPTPFSRSATASPVRKTPTSRSTSKTRKTTTTPKATVGSRGRPRSRLAAVKSSSSRSGSTSSSRTRKGSKSRSTSRTRNVRGSASRTKSGANRTGSTSRSGSRSTSQTGSSRSREIYAPSTNDARSLSREYVRSHSRTRALSPGGHTVISRRSAAAKKRGSGGNLYEGASRNHSPADSDEESSESEPSMKWDRLKNRGSNTAIHSIPAAMLYHSTSRSSYSSSDFDKKSAATTAPRTRSRSAIRGEATPIPYTAHPASQFHSRSTNHVAEASEGRTSDVVHGVLCLIALAAFVVSAVYRLSFYLDIAAPRYESFFSSAHSFATSRSRARGLTGAMGERIGHSLSTLFTPKWIRLFGPFGKPLLALRDYYLFDAGGSFGNVGARYLANSQTMFSLLAIVYVAFSLYRHGLFTAPRNLLGLGNHRAVAVSLREERSAAYRSPGEVAHGTYGLYDKERHPTSILAPQKHNILTRFLIALPSRTRARMYSLAYAFAGTFLFTIATILTSVSVTFPLYITIARQWGSGEREAPQSSAQRLVACAMYLLIAIGSAVLTLTAYRAGSHQSLYKTVVSDATESFVTSATMWNCLLSALFTGFLLVWGKHPTTSDVLRQRIRGLATSSVLKKSRYEDRLETSSITAIPSFFAAGLCALACYATGLAVLPALYLAYVEYGRYEEEMKYNMYEKVKERARRGHRLRSSELAQLEELEGLTSTLRQSGFHRPEPFASATRIVQAY